MYMYLLINNDSKHFQTGKQARLTHVETCQPLGSCKALQRDQSSSAALTSLKYCFFCSPYTFAFSCCILEGSTRNTGQPVWTNALPMPQSEVLVVSHESGVWKQRNDYYKANLHRVSVSECERELCWAMTPQPTLRQCATPLPRSPSIWNVFPWIFSPSWQTLSMLCGKGLSLEASFQGGLWISVNQTSDLLPTKRCRTTLSEGSQLPAWRCSTVQSRC